MPVAHSRLFTAGPQLLQAELAQGLQHHKTGLVVGARDIFQQAFIQ